MGGRITAEPCIVCEDEARDAADLLLLNGHAFRTIARRLERSSQWAEALKVHLYQKHVAGPTKENYTILMVDYLIDAREMLKRELQRPIKEQRSSIISLTHKAIQWTIQNYARVEGFYGTAAQKKISGDVIEALNQLAQGNPEAVKRIADARKKEIPVLTQAKPVQEDN